MSVPQLAAMLLLGVTSVFLFFSQEINSETPNNKVILTSTLYDFFSCYTKDFL